MPVPARVDNILGIIFSYLSFIGFCLAVAAYGNWILGQGGKAGGGAGWKKHAAE